MSKKKAGQRGLKRKPTLTLKQRRQAKRDRRQRTETLRG